MKDVDKAKDYGENMAVKEQMENAVKKKKKRKRIIESSEDEGEGKGSICENGLLITIVNILKSKCSHYSLTHSLKRKTCVSTYRKELNILY